MAAVTSGRVILAQTRAIMHVPQFQNGVVRVATPANGVHSTGAADLSNAGGELCDLEGRLFNARHAGVSLTGASRALSTQNLDDAYLSANAASDRFAAAFDQQQKEAAASAAAAAAAAAAQQPPQPPQHANLFRDTLETLYTPLRTAPAPSPSTTSFADSVFNATPASSPSSSSSSSAMAASQSVSLSSEHADVAASSALQRSQSWRDVQLLSRSPSGTVLPPPPAASSPAATAFGKHASSSRATVAASSFSHNAELDRGADAMLPYFDDFSFLSLLDVDDDGAGQQPHHSRQPRREHALSSSLSTSTQPSHGQSQMMTTPAPVRFNQQNDGMQICMSSPMVMSQPSSKTSTPVALTRKLQRQMAEQLDPYHQFSPSSSTSSLSTSASSMPSMSESMSPSSSAPTTPTAPSTASRRMSWSQAADEVVQTESTHAFSASTARSSRGVNYGGGTATVTPPTRWHKASTTKVVTGVGSSNGASTSTSSTRNRHRRGYTVTRFDSSPTKTSGRSAGTANGSRRSNTSSSSSTARVGSSAYDNEIVIGEYTRRQRRDKIARYRAKRHLRNFEKKTLYQVRKTFACTRVRVGGRFVSKSAATAAAGAAAATDGKASSKTKSKRVRNVKQSA